MMVLVLSACPVGLRGDLTKWLYEVSAGVFIGTVSARVREELWERTKDTSGSGRAILIWSAPGEQKLRFEVHRHHWTPVDLDGLTLMRRPAAPGASVGGAMRKGWSQAGGALRGRQFQRRRRGSKSAESN
ncbi:CRISPR-associated protein Cas2 [Kocuria palustris]|nr:CRISPR-associated protein Cas2 [Kocuria palustris]